MRGIIGIFIAGLLLLPAGMARAQVAVPTFNPGLPNYTALNPAAQQWGAPSRVAVGMVRETETETPADPLSAESETGSDGTFVLGRYVAERWAIGAESAAATSDLTDPDTYDASGDVGQVEVALSGQLGDFLAIGVGSRDTRYTQTTSVSGTKSEVEAVSGLPVLGVSLRLWENLFLGAAYGNETLTVDINGVNLVEETRPVTRYGVGVRFGDTTSGFRAEYAVETRDSIEVEVSTGVFIDANASTTNLASVEFRLANILVGYEATHAEEDEFGDDVESTESVASLGWVPLSGLAVTASMSTKSFQNTTTDDERTATGTAVAIAWMF